MIPSPAYSSLDEALAAIYGLTDDPLADAGTKVVVSRGNPRARLLIVGEAPGPQENIKGKPFVGPAGQLLDKILQAAEFDSENDAYVINSVFRLPPGANGANFRKPNDKEIAFYRPFVFEIMRLVNPLIVLLTGNVACQSVLQKTGITLLRGKWIEMDGRLIMPIFHPSYLLRNQSRAPGSPKSLMWEDMREVRRKYEELSAGG
ncbi:MAG: uracil-DNA glycosylase [Anaerolineales bacterium]|nr:uracil-DNA glycosylase [Anaerolineales bacterium]